MAAVTPVVERWTQRSGVRIRYLDNSPDEPVGLPILLSPGFTDFADEYVEVLEFFAPRRVLVVEVRGRGGSEAPTTGYAAGDHTADLRAVVDEEGLDAVPPDDVLPRYHVGARPRAGATPHVSPVCRSATTGRARRASPTQSPTR